MQIGDRHYSQKQVDEIVQERLLSMTDQAKEDPTAIKLRIDEASYILSQLELPRAQLNERSALTLLALSYLGGKLYLILHFLFCCKNASYLLPLASCLLPLAYKFYLSP